MDERQRADIYIKGMLNLQEKAEERDKLDREIEDLQDRLAEMWGEMGAYVRDRVGLMGRSDKKMGRTRWRGPSKTDSRGNVRGGRVRFP